MRVEVEETTWFRSTGSGSTACLRLKARSWAVSSEAREEAARIWASCLLSVVPSGRRSESSSP